MQECVRLPHERATGRRSSNRFRICDRIPSLTFSSKPFKMQSPCFLLIETGNRSKHALVGHHFDHEKRAAHPILKVSIFRPLIFDDYMCRITSLAASNQQATEQTPSLISMHTHCLVKHAHRTGQAFPSIDPHPGNGRLELRSRRGDGGRHPLQVCLVSLYMV